MQSRDSDGTVSSGRGTYMRPALLVLAAVLCYAAELKEADVAAWIVAQGGTVASDARGHTTAVNLRAVWITDLTRLAGLPHLARLDLSHSHITDLGMERLAPLSGVTELDLGYAEHTTDAGIAHLKRWKALQRLNLRGTKITDTALEHLSTLTSLQSLDVSFTQITNNGLDRLSALTNLRDLALGGNKITDSGIQFLKLLPDLERLDLHGEQRTDSGLWSATVTDEGLDGLAALVHLRDLNLAGTKISDLGLAKLRGLVALESLDLSGTRVSSKGIEWLTNLPALKKLVLWKAQRIDDSAVPYLNAMTHLVYLDVADSKISDAVKKQLRAPPLRRM